MKQLETRVVIEAPVARVWAVLADFPAYPDWNPVVRFSGQPREGAAVPMVVTLFGRSLSVPVHMESIEPRRELRWRGGPAWIMSGQHYLCLEAMGDDRTGLRHGERFEGMALPLLWPLLEAELLRFYGRINEGLKRRAESSSP